MVEPAYTYAAEIIRWVDGDTVWLKVDLGFRMSSAADFRLHGVDTPERGQPGHTEATARVRELAPAGTIVTIHTFRNADKYGRWLAVVYPFGVDRSLNSTLIAEQLAVAYYGGTR